MQTESKAPQTDKTEVLLSVKNLTTEFRVDGGKVHAVNGVSFDLGYGESLAIVGESGSGKSVTMQSIMGLIPSPPGRITAGSAMFKGRDLLSIPEEELRQIRGKDIAIIFQDPMSSLNPVLSIGTQMTEGLIEHQNTSRKDANKKAAEMMALVGLSDPESRMSDHPHEFSGGQLQRIGIAMALICSPSLLIADESTTALDVTIQAQIVELVASLQQKLGMAIIWISHDLSLVAGPADRVAVMYGGNLVERAPVNDLFANPSHPHTRGLLRSIPRLTDKDADLVPIKGTPPNLLAPPEFCVFAPRCASATDECRAQKPVLDNIATDHAVACFHVGNLNTAREVEGAVVRAQIPKGDVLLEVRNLKKYFPIKRGVFRRTVGYVRALDDVSFDVRQGETLGFVGESGCGKSTTGRVVLGLLDPTEGNVVFDGRSIATLTPEQRQQKRRHMQMVFQNPFGALNPRLTLGRIIGEGLRAHGIGDSKSQDARVDELLELVGLKKSWKSRFPHALSGGQRQRVGIARALATEPKFIIADEPISALDVSIQAQVINLLEDLKRKPGLTYLFIGHDLSMMRHISDRIAVMYLGRIVEIGSTEDVFDRTQHPYTKALMSAIPEPDPTKGGTSGRIVLQGTVPSPANPPSGCHFHPRCIFAKDICRKETPALMMTEGVAGTPRGVACHFAGEV